MGDLRDSPGDGVADSRSILETVDALPEAVAEITERTHLRMHPENVMAGFRILLAIPVAVVCWCGVEIVSTREPDHVRDLQTQAIGSGKADWGHWGGRFE